MAAAIHASTRRASLTLLARRAGLFVLYVVVAVAPLALALLGPHPPGRGFWLDAAFGLGLVGMAMLGLQFLSVARINRVDAPYGIDAVMRYHRQIAFVAMAFVTIHPLLLLTEPAYRSLVNPLSAPQRVQWGQAAWLLLAFLMVVAVLRLRLRLNYEVWRITHGALAVAIAALALIHIRSVGVYIGRGTWKQPVFTLTAITFVSLLAWARVIKPLVRWYRPFIVDEVVPRGDGVVSLRLRPSRGSGRRFRAGQFMWLTVGSTFNQDEHPFSISSSAARPECVELTIKRLGDFTARVPAVAPGTTAYLDGPFGNFGVGWESAGELLLVAGGIGITPMMSVLRTMEDTGDSRPVTLVYGNGTWDTVVFGDELQDLATRLALRVVHVLLEPPPDWEGAVGFITPELLRAVRPDDMGGLQCYVCGPPPMMAAVERHLIAEGVPPRQVHAEIFTFV
jgi:predicted ferric reductase